MRSKAQLVIRFKGQAWGLACEISQEGRYQVRARKIKEQKWACSERVRGFWQMGLVSPELAVTGASWGGLAWLKDPDLGRLL